MKVSSAYDPTGTWVSAASSVLHVLHLNTASLTFTTDYTINVSVPPPHSKSDHLGTEYPNEVIMRDGKPDYLEMFSNCNTSISLLTGSLGNATHFRVSSAPSVAFHQKQFFGQNLHRKVLTLKELPGADFPVPFVNDLTTGIALPILTSTQLCEVGRDIKYVLLAELQLFFPEIPPLGDNTILVITKAAPQTFSHIFGDGDIDPKVKKKIEKLASLRGRVAVSPQLGAYVVAEKSAGKVPNASIKVRRKDGTSVRYSITIDAPISPVDFCEFGYSYQTPLPGIYLPGRRDTGIVFLHIHGGPHAKTSIHKFNPFAQYLASYGPVIDVNYPGSTGLGRTYESYSDGNWSGVADILAEIAEHLGREGRKVVAVGTSFGAYATMKIANTHPDLLAGAIAINGVYDLHAALREEAPIGGEKHTMEWTHQFGGADGDEILNHNSVIFGPSPHTGITCPTLLVSGGEDRTCLPAQTEKMFAAIAPSTPAYLLHSKKMGHSHTGDDNVIITSVIGPFLHAYISAKVVFEPFPETTARLAADGKDLGVCGLPGWSLKNNVPGRREMLDAELTAIGAVFH